MATVVGTASAGSIGGRLGSPRWSVPTSSLRQRATVTAVPSGLTRSRSLPAASAIRTSLLGSAASPFGLLSPGLGGTSLSVGSGSAAWYAKMSSTSSMGPPGVAWR